MTQNPQAIQEKKWKYLTSLQNKTSSAWQETSRSKSKVKWQTEKKYFQLKIQRDLFFNPKEKSVKGISWQLTRKEIQVVYTCEKIHGFIHN